MNKIAILLAGAVALAGCASQTAAPVAAPITSIPVATVSKPEPRPAGLADAQVGLASWYSMGRQTANGERYNPDGISAAHRTLPFGTKVLVEDISSGRSVVVRINDRGPFVKHRIIDVSRGAARELGLIKRGVTKVRVTVLERPAAKVVRR